MTQSLYRLKTSDLLSFITLHSALSTGSPAALALGLSESEALAVFSAVEALLGTDADRKAEVIRGFFAGEGEWNSVPCKALAITPNDALSNPPSNRYPFPGNHTRVSESSAS